LSDARGSIYQSRCPKVRKKDDSILRRRTGYITRGEFNAIVSIDKGDYPMRVHIVLDTLMKHKLLIGADFLNSVQVTMNAGEIAINASESIPGNEEICEVC
jgi:hypothetical protein